MKNVLEKLNIDIINTGKIYNDVYKSFIIHDLNRVLEHTKRVITKSEEIAKKYNFDLELAKLAALLHDVSGVIRNDLRIEACRYSNINILKEEILFPLLTHQKLSKKIAEDIYKVENKEVLSAIECHTTLKNNPSKLDLIIFIADKLEWDQEGIPPYYDEMEKALLISLENSAFVYVEYLLSDKKKLKVIHPWLIEAREYLYCKLS